jgi:hypothetical protein
MLLKRDIYEFIDFPAIPSHKRVEGEMKMPFVTARSDIS